MQIRLSLLAVATCLLGLTAVAETPKEIPPASLKFDQPTEVSERPRPTRGLGPTASVMNGFSGFGLIFENPVTEKLNLWAQLNYGSHIHIFNAPPNSSGFDTDPVELNARDRIAITAGADAHLFLNNRHSWSLFAGAGGGIERVRVEATSYPQICGPFWCGFDSNQPFTDSKTVTAALAYYRLGIKASQLLNQVDLALTIVGQPLRWPKFVELNSYDKGVQQVNPDNTGYLQFETTYRF